MKNETIKNAVLVRLERCNNSVNGNPKYECTWKYGDNYLTGKTGTDYACGYAVTNYHDGKRLADVTYHYTGKGIIIITGILDSK